MCFWSAALYGVIDRLALESCVGLIALSLSVVMAGTGHLPTLKLLRGGAAPQASVGARQANNIGLRRTPKAARERGQQPCVTGVTLDKKMYLMTIVSSTSAPPCRATPAPHALQACANG